MTNQMDITANIEGGILVKDANCNFCLEVGGNSCSTISLPEKVEIWSPTFNTGTHYILDQYTVIDNNVFMCCIYSNLINGTGINPSPQFFKITSSDGTFDIQIIFSNQASIFGRAARSSNPAQASNWVNNWQSLGLTALSGSPSSTVTINPVLGTIISCSVEPISTATTGYLLPLA